MDDRWEPVKKQLLAIDGQFVLCQPYPNDENLRKVTICFEVSVRHGNVFLVKTDTRMPKLFETVVKQYKDYIFYICVVGWVIEGGENNGVRKLEGSIFP